MKLAFYTPNYPGITQDGGIGSYTKSLAHSLSKLGHTVHVITLGTGGESKDGEVTVHQVNLRHVPLIDRWMPGFGSCWHLSRKLVQVVKQHAIDLVELPNWEGLGIFYQKKQLTPTVVRLHTSSLETQQIDQLPSTRLLQWDVKREHQQARQADLLITHSEAHRQMMCDELGCQPEKITLIPHGVEVFPKFTRPPRPPGPPQLVFLGRLEKRKGTLELLQAFPSILEEHPGTMLTLIGTDRAHCPPTHGGSDRTHAQWIADELPASVQKQIVLAGRLPQDEVDRHLQTADVFIAPSRYESFGLIYPEAMRWGIPVIGCNVGGVPEIITHGETGLLCQPESPAGIAQAVDQLLSDDNLRIRLGMAGKQHVERAFSAEVMAQRVIDNFGMLLAAHTKQT
jgi:glycogen(starch) synthase